FDGSGPPGSSQVFNNHLPLDPALGGAVAITKTTPSLNVSRGDLVPYEITFDNGLPVPLEDLSLVDRYPAGFRYIEGSARIDGVPVEPTIQGRELVWTDVGVDALASRSVVLLLGVGAGVREGEFVNRAQAFSSVTGLGLSGEASATVRVVPDPTFDCTDVLGKVFDDRNRDGIQDAGENGIAGVRLMTVRGLAVTTDPEGRFHITCAVVPDETRGSNFVLKLDDRSLPSGYRMSTRQTQVQRATRGKALRFRFGASIHRVVGLDVADPVFVPGETSLRAQWRPRIERLLDELEKGRGVLRLSYVADVEASRLVDRRLEALKKLIRAAWEERGEKPLEIETEIFWRRGGPSERSTAPIDPGSRTSRLPPVGAGPPGLELAPGRSVERSLPVDEPITRWSVDPERIEKEVSDRLEEREVSRPQVETVKRTDVVPPIRFESGAARIPADSIERLRAVLDEMQSLPNVRLHLVGHADDQPLSPDLARLFGDNEGLSRERAGEVAELLQEALSLPPESISYSWAGASRPVVPNDSDRGQALNRRVEVEVWSDEIEETTAVEEVVVPEDFKRVKVCRTETVCRLRYRVGHERRTRLRNLVPPLDYGEEVLDVPQRFLDQI
ncbi:MAG TPA: OmpA family protein, partial [Myxococcota bacterium]|nr:OmpA family protein [Myxococcota bacterium]